MPHTQTPTANSAAAADDSAPGALDAEVEAKWPEAEAKGLCVRACVWAFLSEEVIRSGYDCDACTARVARLAPAGEPSPKPRQPAVRWYALSRLPRTLTLHLKRFAAQRGRCVKVSAHVDFPLRLELGPFCAAAGPPPTHLDQLRAPPLVDGATARGGYGQYRQYGYGYELSAVVVHQGSMRGGHYTAYVRGGASGWFHISDTRVVAATEREVLDSQAFLLFYDAAHTVAASNGDAGADEDADTCTNAVAAGR